MVVRILGNAVGISDGIEGGDDKYFDGNAEGIFEGGATRRRFVLGCNEGFPVGSTVGILIGRTFGKVLGCEDSIPLG